MGGALRCLAVIAAGLALAACGLPSGRPRGPRLRDRRHHDRRRRGGRRRHPGRAADRRRRRSAKRRRRADDRQHRLVLPGRRHHRTSAPAARASRSTSAMAATASGAGSARRSASRAGPGTDKLDHGRRADVLAGGAGNDTLNGGGGVDEYFGERRRRDRGARRQRRADLLRRGQMTRLDNDFIDIIAECERGSTATATASARPWTATTPPPAISGGARGVRQRRRRELRRPRQPEPRRDRDGFPRPLDCDDGNAGDPPDAPEIRGNGVDENCDQRAEPFADSARSSPTGGCSARAFTRLRSSSSTTRRGRRVGSAARAQLPVSARSARTVQRVLARVVAPPGLPQRAAAARHEARGDDHGRRDHRADVHLRRQARRAPDKHDRLPCSRREQGAGVLRAARSRSPRSMAALARPRRGRLLPDQGRHDHLHRRRRRRPDRRLRHRHDIRFTRFGGVELGAVIPCVVTDDNQTVDCPRPHRLRRAQSRGRR